MSSNNTYISTIINLSNDGKYLKWYCSIINNAINRATTKKEAKLLLDYIECHHIVPKCFFLETKSKFSFIDGNKNDKENLVYLTGREHFICHILLVKMLKYKKHKHAMSPVLSRMKCDKLQYFNSNSFELARKLSSKYHHNKLEEFKLNQKNKPSKLKNRTYEEIHGENKATYLKQIRSQIFKQLDRHAEKNSRYDHTIYNFFNIKTQEHYISTRYDFYSKYNINKGGVCSMIRHGITYNSWKIIPL